MAFGGPRGYPAGMSTFRQRETMTRENMAIAGTAAAMIVLFGYFLLERSMNDSAQRFAAAQGTFQDRGDYAMSSRPLLARKDGRTSMDVKPYVGVVK